MTSRARLRAIMAGQPADRCGLWLGNPHADTWPILHRYFGTSTEEELRRLLHDDFRWIAPWNAYRHPAGKPMFDTGGSGASHSAPGRFAECEDPAMIEDMEWPDPAHLDFSATVQELRAAGDFYRASGFWSSFFHEVAAFFGMENYFVKMHTHPAVVHAVTRHVVDFHLEANRRFLAAAGSEMDGLFCGNDFGSQLDLLISPAAFDEFILPYYRELTNLGHAHGVQVLLHSCGAVQRIIPRFIELGVNGLHPLQARAAGMDAATLAARFGGRITFIGGIDTQQLLVHGTPAQVYDEVQRVKAILGPRLVVSPSHEAVLPNVPPANLEAMARAALA